MYQNLIQSFNNNLNSTYTHTTKEQASYYYEIINKTLILYFQMSYQKRDWINNFNFPCKPYRDMKEKWYCHRGFLKVFKDFEPVLAEILETNTIDQVYITGYSHGGPLAILSHEYIKYHYPSINVSTNCFGSPRVVWGFLKKNIKERFTGITIIRNSTDIVTHLPPFIFGFRHIGNILHIGRYNYKNPIKSHYASEYINDLK